ncbi:MAG: DUF1559 domain-containing protein [Rubripirellula sp.]|nr:DUF1559 domain-containing protein [Rubripirellula sp.]
MNTKYDTNLPAGCDHTLPLGTIPFAMNSRLNRHRLTVIGLTLLEVIGVIVIIGVALALLLPNVRNSREAALRMSCSNQLKQIGLALHNYHSAHKQLPSAMGGTSIPKKGMSNAGRLSGLVSLLPFVEEQAAWEQVSQSGEFPSMGPEPWDSRYAPWTQQINAYQCPLTPPAPSKFGFTNYTFCIGDVAEQIHQPSVVRGVFACGRNTRFKDIRDGLSNTVAMAEIGNISKRLISGQFVTGQPESFLTDPGSTNSLCQGSFYEDELPLSELGRGGCWADGAAGVSLFNTILPPNSPSLAVGGIEAVDGIYSAGSQHSDGAHVLMTDGAVVFITKTIDAGDPHQPPPTPNDLETDDLDTDDLDTGDLDTGDLESPYGLWGAMGTANAGESKPGKL